MIPSNDNARVDVTVENHGSIYLVDALTIRAQAWIATKVDCEAQLFGGKLVPLKDRLGRIPAKSSGERFNEELP